MMADIVTEAVPQVEEDAESFQSTVIQLGDKFSSHITPEDSCSYMVVIEDNIIGEHAVAAFKGSWWAVFILAIHELPPEGRRKRSKGATAW